MITTFNSIRNRPYFFSWIRAKFWLLIASLLFPVCALAENPKLVGQISRSDLVSLIADSLIEREITLTLSGASLNFRVRQSDPIAAQALFHNGFPTLPSSAVHFRGEGQAGAAVGFSLLNFKSLREFDLLGALVSKGESYTLSGSAKLEGEYLNLTFSPLDDLSHTTSECGLTETFQTPISGQSVGVPDGPTPPLSPLMELALVLDADSLYVSHFGTPSAAQGQIAAIINAANVIYENQIGIRFVVRRLNTWSTTEPFSSPIPQYAWQLRDQFGAYARSYIAPRYLYDIGYLFSGRSFGQVIGISNFGAICDAYRGYGASLSAFSPLSEVGVFTHEIGHLLQATHSACQGNDLMCAYHNAAANQFVSASVAQMTNYAPTTFDCLSPVNPGAQLSAPAAFFATFQARELVGHQIEVSWSPPESGWWYSAVELFRSTSPTAGCQGKAFPPVRANQATVAEFERGKTYYFSARGVLYPEGYQRLQRDPIATQVGPCTPVSVVSVPQVLPPVILQHPADQFVPPQGTAVFSVSALGDALSYQWERQTSAAGAWIALAGQISPQLVISGVNSAMNGFRYRVRITNSTGSLVSFEANLLVQ